jgi:hypothetical protein
LRFPHLGGGANKPSLVQAQKNYMTFGACEKGFERDVRKPQSTEMRDPNWRPVDEELDKFEENFKEGDKFVEYPDDHTSLYYWKDNYWRR